MGAATFVRVVNTFILGKSIVKVKINKGIEKSHTSILIKK